MELGALVEGLRARGIPVELTGDPGTPLGVARHDSRDVAVGDLFACVPGAQVDGHDFAAGAVASGAAALLAERPLDEGVPVAVAPSVRAALGPAAALLAGDPSERLTVVGVTGTNGKTTVSYLLEAILVAAGRTPRVIGTLTGARTTPEAPELQAAFVEALDGGADSVVMEVSSHALDLHRVDGTRFTCAVFTNLSADHLDHHGSMEAYFRAKARFFEPDLAERAVLNLDDPHGRLLADTTELDWNGFSMADAEELELAGDHAAFTWRGHRIRLAMTGGFNVANALAAATAAVAVGIAEDVVAEGLSRPVAVPGRMERIGGDQDFTVLVDFAHTPDGLRAVLEAAHEVAAPGGRVRVVFGCGGDRDPDKRPLMGAVAAALADRTIVTSDNSRSEPTSAIIDAVLSGYEREATRRPAEVEPDRRAAIASALASAEAGDVVVIAGKGHEATQTIGDQTVAFDDRDVVREELAALGLHPGRGGIGT